MSTAPPPTTDAAPQAAAKSGKSKKLIIVVGIAVVILLQLGVVYYMFGTAKKKTDPLADGAVVAEAKGDDGALGELVEVPVGNSEYNCTNGKAAKDVVFHVNFRVVALVTASQRQAFIDAMKTSEARIREAIIKVGRNSSHEELNDPHASSIKRLIREDINKILKKSYVQNIVISDFTVIEH